MIILDFNRLPEDLRGNTIVTIGNFDGVHTGHQELIKRAIADAKRYHLQSVSVTFEPHPAAYFQPQQAPLAICSLNYKIRLMAALGVDALLVLTFNKELAHLEAEDYVRKILLEKLKVEIIWVGYDFTFGRQRTGNVRLLIELGEKYNFQTNVLAPHRISDVVVSSTKIRELIKKGDVEHAAKLLRRKHVISGMVIAGDSKGHKLGFPTINLAVAEGLIPGNGIYSGIAFVRGINYPAAIYIGYRPTFMKSDFRIEAHLPGFSGNLYGCQVTLAFLKFIREDIKFSNYDDLKNRINQDAEMTRQDFKNYMLNNDNIPIIW